MEYQKIINLFDNTSKKNLSEFLTKHWVEIDDDKRGTYNINSQIDFKNTIFKSSLWDHGDAYILFSFE